MVTTHEVELIGPEKPDQTSDFDIETEIVATHEVEQMELA
jgi:hypothetical protein